MTDQLRILPDLLEIRPYTMRNNHAIVEVSYAGVVLGDMFVPERSTLAVYDELAKATVRRKWSLLSAHMQFSVLEAEAEAIAALESS